MSDFDPATAERLRWAIRSSFVDYIAALEDGVIEGARDETGAFVFAAEGIPAPAGEQSTGAAEGSARFGGTVSLRGHAGALSLTIADPWVSVEHGRGALSVRVADGRRIELVTLAGAADTATGVRFDDVELTIDGAGLFDGNYRPFARFAPVDLDLCRDPDRPS